MFLETCITTKLKYSDIIPLFKKKLRSIIGKYRPVKLLSTISKIFERILINRLQPYLENNFLYEDQSGSRHKFSIDEQIIYTFEKIKIELNKNSNIGIFIDISKAFYRIWRKAYFISYIRNLV